MTAPRRALLLPLAVGLVVRLAWVSLAQTPTLNGDQIAYVGLAQSLLAGHGYTLAGQPITHYMPGWPLLLALCFALHLGVTGARVLLCLLSTAVCWEASSLARRLVSPRAEIAAAWVAALFPPLVWYANPLLSEVPSAAMVGLWAVVAVAYLQDGGGWRRVALLGLVSGLLVLFRAEMLPLVPLPFLARAIVVGWRGQVAGAIAVVALTALMLLPWAAYNQHRLGKPVLLTTAGGVGLWFVSHEPPFSDFAAPEVETEATAFRVPGDPVLTDARFAAEAKARIRARPGTYLARRLANLPRFWLGSQTEPVTEAAPSLSQALQTRNLAAIGWKVVGFGAQVLMTLTALAGLVLFARRRELLFPWLVLGVKVLAHAPFVQNTRFSLHLAPILLCYSGATALWLIDRVRAQRRVAPTLVARSERAS